MSFLDRVRHYIPNVAAHVRSLMSNPDSPAARRARAQCPFCEYTSDCESTDWETGKPKYAYTCTRCNLKFRKSFLNHADDHLYELQIVAHCPKCKKFHAPYIVGSVESTTIPCESCWDELVQDEALLLLPGKVQDDDETRKFPPIIIDDDETKKIISARK